MYLVIAIRSQSRFNVFSKYKFRLAGSSEECTGDEVWHIQICWSQHLKCVEMKTSLISLMSTTTKSSNHFHRGVCINVNKGYT